MDITPVLLDTADEIAVHRTLRSFQLAAASCGDVCVRSAVRIAPENSDSESPQANDLPIFRCRIDETLQQISRRVKSEYVCTVRAGDLVSQTWLAGLTKMFAARNRRTPTIGHAEWTALVGPNRALIRHPNSEEVRRDVGLVLNHPWSTLSAFRTVDAAVGGMDHAGSFATYQDLFSAWYAELLSVGATIETVPNELNFVYPENAHLTLRVATRITAMDALRARPKTGPRDAVASDSAKRAAISSAARYRFWKSWVEARFPRAFRLAKSARNRLLTLRHLTFIPQIQSLTTGPSQLTSDLYEKWLYGHRLAPEVWPAPVGSHSIHLPICSPSVRLYERMAERLPRSFQYVVLVPWLIPAGADLEVLNYVELLAERGLAGDILVIADRNHESPWAARLPVGVTFFAMGEEFPTATDVEKSEALGLLLLHMQPQVIHNINSACGYQAFELCGAQLARRSRLYALCFCADYTPEGRAVSYVIEKMPKVFCHLTALFSDNARLPDELHRLFGFSRHQMYVHYQPIDEAAFSTERKTVYRKGSALRVLWAGRLDRQKRPDILAEIARRTARRRIDYHVFGYSHLDPKASCIRGLSNIHHHGKYDRFRDLHPGEYDAFLYTAEWDGLPNVLLEAIACGLPVIAPNVGGIGELIRDGDTGCLVSRCDAIDEYLDALDQILYGDERGATMSKNALRLLRERHSWEAFQSTVATVPGYLPLPSEKPSIPTGDVPTNTNLLARPVRP